MSFLLGIVLIGILIASQTKSEATPEVGMKKRKYNLDDVDPSYQGGAYDKDYDIFFEDAADKYNIPFALIKAHAIQESSLNPNAFMDENPQGKAERKGWASRGLMQVLWWPGSERFKKFGYADRDIGLEGGSLFDPHINVDIGARIIADNLSACGGSIRDAINMYNTGKKESVYPAPFDYTKKVFNNYLTLLGKGKV